MQHVSRSVPKDVLLNTPVQCLLIFWSLISTKTFSLSIITLFLMECVILNSLRKYLNTVDFSCGLLMLSWLLKNIFN